ncbi:hypothetical protein RDWZM_007939 [Blomia tropicalis]|uniref:Transmembrane protein 177 n=1 Tax=Blomia tropicalis TaxID=40697 RepID=A0A9Q0M3H2_BLOTA|nr:hypothetical protein RDWZM_007939 [Blomia tropicalis]
MLRAFPNMFRTKLKDIADSIRFLSKSERRAIYLGTTITLSCAGTGLYFSIHSIANDTVMEQLQMYRKGYGIPVNPNLYQLLQQTIDEMKISDSNTNSSVGLFNFVGNDLYSIGSLKLPFGSYIGVPYNYNFINVKQLRIEDIRLLLKFRTKRTTESPVIKKLFESLILSESAKKYAIAHELFWLSSSYLFVKTANILLCTIGSFLLAPTVNRKLGFTGRKKLIPRLSIGLLCFTLVTVLAGSIIDQLLDEIYDIRALKQTLQQAPNDEYRRGAEEYYSKLIERNCALYELLGPYGSQFYTEDGRTKRLFGLMSQSYENHLILTRSL